MEKTAISLKKAILARIERSSRALVSKDKYYKHLDGTDGELFDGGNLKRLRKIYQRDSEHDIADEKMVSHKIRRKIRNIKDSLVNAVSGRSAQKKSVRLATT